MKPRSTLVELFSTFLQVKTLASSNWLTEPKLRRSMQSCLTNSFSERASERSKEQFGERVDEMGELTDAPDKSRSQVVDKQADGKIDQSRSEFLWAMYWYHEWLARSNSGMNQSTNHATNHGKNGLTSQSTRQSTGQSTSQSSRQLNNNLAYEHLAAYLQEPCYWAVRQVVCRFPNLQGQFSDYFQMTIAETATVLRRFKPERGGSLRSYGELSLSSILRDRLRQQHEADLSSDWQLLRKSSHKGFTSTLQQMGASTTTIAQYELAWRCFQEFYVPTTTTGTLPKIDGHFWQQVAELYNSQRGAQLPTSSASIGARTIEQWLTQCSTWLRRSRYPQLRSLNFSKSDEGAGELQDDLSDEQTESVLTDLIEQEDWEARRSQQRQIQTVLVNALTSLEPERQLVLQLYYQEQLTQQQMQQRLGLSQATISRRLKQTKERLLTLVLQWSQQNLNISVTPDLIKQMSTALEEWLQTHYHPSEIASLRAEGEPQ